MTNLFLNLAEKMRVRKLGSFGELAENSENVRSPRIEEVKPSWSMAQRHGQGT